MEAENYSSVAEGGAPMRRGLFVNPWASTWQDKSLADVLRWVRERRKLKVSSKGWLEGQPYPSKAELQARLPLLGPAGVEAGIPTGSVQAIWVGHATVLCRMALQNGRHISFITDPVFSRRCAPVQWAGPARVVPAAFLIEDTKALPHLDFVLISHNHYDHLDSGSVGRLAKRFGSVLKWFIPLGLKAWFLKEGIHNVQELDWWQEVEFEVTDRTRDKDAEEVATVTANSSSLASERADGRHLSGAEAEISSNDSRSISRCKSKITITMTPAQHWSARGAFDRCKSLWGGYLVRAHANSGSVDKHSHGSRGSLSFWFAGDTGYCDVFKQIGERFGPIDLSAIPIGAYEPRWFMKAQHVDPEEALKVHADVQSRQSLAIHWGTFPLSNEALDAPPRQLVEAQAALGSDKTKFLAVHHGEQVLVKDGRLLNTPRCISV